MPEVAKRKSRPKFSESGTQAGQAASWSQWDIGKSLQLLHSLNPSIVRRELRRMHLRWHHASSLKMQTILRNTGAPKSVLQQIPSIIDTCSICRGLAAPGNKTISTTRSVTRFNEVVQHDLLFANAEGGKPRESRAGKSSSSSASGASPSGHIADSVSSTPDKVPWQHMLDVATRLSQAAMITDKTTRSILESAARIWFNPYRPPRFWKRIKKVVLSAMKQRLIVKRWEPRW